MLLSCAQVREPSAVVEHEASTSKIGEDQLFYFQSRGVEAEAAVGMIISGFCREVRHTLALRRALVGGGVGCAVLSASGAVWEQDRGA